MYLFLTILLIEVLIFAGCFILSECCKVDERSLILHDETDGEGENVCIFNHT